MLQVLSARSSSASSSRAGNLTPTSGSVSSVFAFRAGGNEETRSETGRLNISGASQPDQTPSSEPIASIERSPSPAFTFNVGRSSSIASTPRSSTFRQSSTPSISISTPPPTNSVTMSSALPSDTRGESLVRGLQDLELSSTESVGQLRSSLDLRGIEAALDGLVTHTSGSNKPPRDSGSLFFVATGTLTKTVFPTPRPNHTQGRG